MFWKDKSKVQADDIPVPEGLPQDVIVSPDTRRDKRIPPGQSRTKKWPVLDASGPPAIDSARWRLRVGGLVGKPIEWGWEDFMKLPTVKVFADLLRHALVATGQRLGGRLHARTAGAGRRRAA